MTRRDLKRFQIGCIGFIGCLFYAINPISMVSEDFKYWKKWFLWEIEAAIASSAGFEFDSSGYLIRILDAATVADLNLDFKINIKFLRQFTKLCASYGIDLKDLGQLKLFDNSDGDRRWLGTSGLLTENISHACYRLIGSGLTELDQISKRKDFISDYFTDKNGVYKKRRDRLPTNICRTLIFFLTTYQGDETELSQLRKYLSGQEFENDLNLVVKRLVSKANEPKTSDFDDGSFDIQNIEVPKPILQLKNFRGSKNLGVWRSKWLYDLNRYIQSEGMLSITKAAKSGS